MKAKHAAELSPLHDDSSLGWDLGVLSMMTLSLGEQWATPTLLHFHYTKVKRVVVGALRMQCLLMSSWWRGKKCWSTSQKKLNGNILQNYKIVNVVELPAINQQFTCTQHCLQDQCRNRAFEMLLHPGVWNISRQINTSLCSHNFLVFWIFCQQYRLCFQCCQKIRLWVQNQFDKHIFKVILCFRWKVNRKELSVWLVISSRIYLWSVRLCLLVHFSPPYIQNQPREWKPKQICHVNVQLILQQHFKL